MKKRRLLFGLVACGLLASTSSTLLERTELNPKQGIKYDSVASATNGGSFNKITSTSQLTDGDYLIVYEAGNVAFDGSLSTLDDVSNTIDVTITDGSIILDNTNKNSYFTIDNTAQTIKSASGYYIGKTANSNGLNSSTTVSYTNEIAFNNGNSVITSSGGPILQFNSTSGQERFRYFKSSQQAIQLYKFVEDEDEVPEGQKGISYGTSLDGITNNDTYPTSYTNDGTTVVTLNPPTKEDYKFVDWTVVDENDHEIEVAYDENKVATFTPPANSGNLTITANWQELATFTITYNSNGGSSVASETLNEDEVALGAKFTRPSDPTKPHCTFAGWYTDDGTFNNLYDFNSTPSTINVYAKWDMQAAEATYPSNSWVEGNTYRVIGEIVSVPSGSEAFLKSGSNFILLYDSGISNIFKVGNDVDVFGVYSIYNGTKELTSVSVNSNNNNTVVQESAINDPAEIVEANVNSYVSISGLKLSTNFNSSNNGVTSIDGEDFSLYCKFKSYITGGGNSYLAGTYVDVTGIVNVHNDSVQIRLNSIKATTMYAVHFNTNGGSAIADASVPNGKTVSAPASNPTKEKVGTTAYTFAGWYSDSECTELFDFNTPITAETTIYAGWNETTQYTVTYNTNGGSNVASETVNQGQKFTKPADPTHENVGINVYTFVGWYSDEECQNAYDFNTIPNDNLTLYAKWSTAANPTLARDAIENTQTKASLSYKYTKVENEDVISDTITHAEITNSSTSSYTEFSVETPTTDAVYEGVSCHNTSYIQIKSGSDSGFVVSSSTRYIKSISIKLNKSTSTLQFYGKSTAYNGSSNLYSNDEKVKGELDGTLECTTTEATYEFKDSYRYFGIKPSSGTAYIDSIKITWKENDTFTYSNVGIRFGGLVEKGAFNALSIQSYGIMVGSAENVVKAKVDTNTTIEGIYTDALFLNDDNTSAAIDYLRSSGIAVIESSDASPATATPSQKGQLEGDYYIWNAYINIPNTSYFDDDVTAVAFIKVDGEYIFLDEKTTNVINLAKSYNPSRNDGYDGSLYYLANNNWGN